MHQEIIQNTLFRNVLGRTQTFDRFKPLKYNIGIGQSKHISRTHKIPILVVSLYVLAVD